MSATSGSVSFEIATNTTGRVFRAGEIPSDILGCGRRVLITAAWFAMCLAGLLEYTWGTVAGSLQAAHHWSLAQTFWATGRQELRRRRARCGPATLSIGPRGPPGHRGGG